MINSNQSINSVTLREVIDADIILPEWLLDCILMLHGMNYELQMHELLTEFQCDMLKVRFTFAKTFCLFRNTDH